MKNYEKWEKYELGNVAFINKTKDYLHKRDFVKHVIDNDLQSVIEIGPGELIECGRILEANTNVHYSIVEVSDLFIQNCKSKFPDVNIVRSPVEDIVDVTRHDIVYLSAVIEHSRDVKAFIEKAMTLGKQFYFVMFKWSYEGGLDSVYNKKKKYWSSWFNVNRIIDEISNHGTIERLELAQGNEFVDFVQYSRGKSGKHRTGDYLIIKGTVNV